MKLGCSYFGNRILRHLAQDMKTLANQGFNFIVHTFSEFDLMFHKGNMKDIVSVTHDAGHEVHLDPWGIGNVFGGEPFSNFAAQNIFTGCQELDDGKPAPFACPNNPLFRDYMKGWIDAVAQSGADFAFWDEPHFHNPAFLGGRPGRWGCRCSFCQKLYMESRSAPMPKEEADDVKAFKRECLREFVGKLTKWAHEAGLKNALCVPPHLGVNEVREHWSLYTDVPHLSILGTDPYWMWQKKPVAMVGEYAVELKKLCDEANLEPQLWIQNCRIEKGREDEIARAVELAWEAGIKNLATWGIEGCANESWITCDDPPKAWEILVDSFRKWGQSVK
ncbi:hypothetical protein JW926_18770 [Candidatus Sumerlaeota bacterium]|nr:hypothetical protein [Candidatus Sumerlaeota bacterium]